MKFYFKKVCNCKLFNCREHSRTWFSVVIIEIGVICRIEIILVGFNLQCVSRTNFFRNCETRNWETNLIGRIQKCTVKVLH